MLDGRMATVHVAIEYTVCVKFTIDSCASHVEKCSQVR
jgi:hypothetical protein